MPELPEVETIANDLRKAGLPGKKILKASIFWPRSIGNLSPEDFASRIRHQTVVSVGRRAKFLVITLSSGDTLLIHLRMSGRLTVHQSTPSPGKHDHVIIDFDDGTRLNFHDTRKFGRWYLIKDPQSMLGKLGPEPFDPSFTPEILEKMLKAKQRQIKPLLLDQNFIAGLGNIYVDEALWSAQIHPMKISSNITHKESQELFKSIRMVLSRGLETQGTSLGKGKANFYGTDGRQGKHQDVLNVFRRTGKPCPRCGSPIERIVVAQRSTHICPTCQRNGKK